MRVAYLSGSDQHSGLVHDPAQTISTIGSTDVYHLWTPLETKRLHIPRNYNRLRLDYDLSKMDVAINLVTDADNNPKVLEHLVKIVKSCRGRVINRPEYVLRTTRDQVARRAAGIDGLIAPATVVFAGNATAARSAALRAGMTFPAILRQAGSHGGQTAQIVESPEAVVAALVAGRPHALTPFVETRRADGLYAKYRVFFFGEQAVVRHMIVSDHWNVHASARTRFMADRPEIVAEERAVISAGFEGLPEEAQAALRELHRRLQLDFHGIDFGFTADGRVVLFEANATMNFFPVSDDPVFDYLEIARQAASVAYRTLVETGGARG